MADIDILKQLFDKKIIRILDIFLSDKSRQLYLREISREASVSPATTYRILKRLKDAEIIKEIKISKFKVYQIQENEKTKNLSRVIKSEVNPLDIFVDQVKNIKSIDSVILHGKKTSKGANILLIGMDDSSGKIDEISKEIEKKHNFKIDFLIISDFQFRQMTRLGVYSGDKKVLWEKE
ncbi:MAG: winged helix-turn-helix domain-containing protein [Candidatus Nanoarchaeia archaeon]|nr:winged helix-turn-helix domain-containing protein [Candidatus Nanoarchaeia archaeon]